MTVHPDSMGPVARRGEPDARREVVYALPFGSLVECDGWCVALAQVEPGGRPRVYLRQPRFLPSVDSVLASCSRHAAVFLSENSQRQSQSVFQ